MAIVTCKCGQRNRIPDGATPFGDSLKCGKCGQAFSAVDIVAAKMDDSSRGPSVAFDPAAKKPHREGDIRQWHIRLEETRSGTELWGLWRGEQPMSALYPRATVKQWLDDELARDKQMRKLRGLQS